MLPAGKGVADLAVCGRLSPGKFPGVGEALDPGYHPDGQLRGGGYGEIGPGDFVGDAKPVYAELLPGFASPRRA